MTFRPMAIYENDNIDQQLRHSGTLDLRCKLLTLVRGRFQRAQEVKIGPVDNDTFTSRDRE